MTEDNSQARLVHELRSTALRMRAGDRLPPVRELVARHHVSPLTVQRAVAQLVAEGIVETHPGSGTFVLDPLATAAARPDFAWQAVALGGRTVSTGGLDELLTATGSTPNGRDVLQLRSAYLDESLQPLRELAAAAGRAARRPAAWQRMPLAGLLDLRAWFAIQIGPPIRPADVLVTSGGQAALAGAFAALAAPGAAVLMEDPTYLGAIAAARVAGLRPVPVPTDRHGIRPDLLAAALRDSGARLLYMQPTYANPHGATLAPDRRAAVIDAVARAEAFLIEDDWARWFPLDTDRAPPPLICDDEHGHVVHISSLTKATAPSLRVGALAARGPAAARLRAVRVVSDFFVAGPLQETALEMVTAPMWPRHLKRARSALRARRDALLHAISHHPDVLELRRPPNGGLHLWVQLPDGVPDQIVSERLAQEGVLVSPGSAYAVAETAGAHLRLTYASADVDPARLAAGLDTIAQVVQDAAPWPTSGNASSR